MRRTKHIRAWCPDFEIRLRLISASGEFQNQKDTSNLLIPVSFSISKFVPEGNIEIYTNFEITTLGRTKLSSETFINVSRAVATGFNTERCEFYDNGMTAQPVLKSSKFFCR
jgi:hypothetical protein